MHRRAADRTGNSAEALQPRAVGLDRSCYQCVPIHARAGKEDRAPMRRGKAGDVRDANLEDKARESGIGNDEVAAAAQHEQWQLVRAREPNCVNDFGFAARFGKVARRSTDAKRRERS